LKSGPDIKKARKKMNGSIGSFTGPFSALDFFAGSGLVRLGLQERFQPVWSNDVCPKKAAFYIANFPSQEFVLKDICQVRGEEVPAADLAWASFPCQDLSLAGAMSGMRLGTRSGLFWQWIRVLDELSANGKRPPVLCAENVVGFLSAGQGSHFRAAYRALRERGYVAGAVVLDARWFLPQSRPRAFLIAAAADLPLVKLTQQAPSGPFHPRSVIQAANAVDDREWLWWSLPAPPFRTRAFADICEVDAPCEPSAKTQRLLKLLSSRHRAKLKAAIDTKSFLVGTGYRRTRPDEDGIRSQKLELRFDGIAGCLRTPEGGSSRQIVLMVNGGSVRSRLLTVRECARLMGADDNYALPGSYNDGYRAMGDAVAAPVTRFLSEHLLAPLARRTNSNAA